MILRQRDLALDADPARRYLPWLVAMIVYLAGLSLAGMMGLASAVDRWDAGLKGTVTVQVPAGAVGTRAVEALLPILRRTEGVRSARPLSAAATAELLEPWLGKEALTQGLALPRLIDVKIDTDRAKVAEHYRAYAAEKAPE